MSAPSSPGKGSSPSLSTTSNRASRHNLARHLQKIFKVNYQTALDKADAVLQGGPSPAESGFWLFQNGDVVNFTNGEDAKI